MGNGYEVWCEEVFLRWPDIKNLLDELTDLDPHDLEAQHGRHPLAEKLIVLRARAQEIVDPLIESGIIQPKLDNGSFLE